MSGVWPRLAVRLIDLSDVINGSRRLCGRVVELGSAVQKIRCSLDLSALWALCFQLLYNTL